MTAADLIRFLLELDAQWLTSRPLPCGRAAELVAALCEHAEPSFRDPKRLGDWRSIDLSSASGPAPRDPVQPTVGLAEEVERLRAALQELVEQADHPRYCGICSDDAYNTAVEKARAMAGGGGGE